jgi:large subunit ribosomal protein L6
MSRVSKLPISIPTGVNVTLEGNLVIIKGAKGQDKWNVHSLVQVIKNENSLTVAPTTETTQAWIQAGTTRALLANMVIGVTKGFEKKLTLVGVGYRAQAKGQILNLTLGFSHPIDFTVPDGIKVETPSQTDIVLSGANYQQLGQVAAKIRSFRPPEPYKGKGVRYVNEQILRKEVKKK